MRSLKDVLDRCTEVGECWQWSQAVNSAGTPMTYYEARNGVSALRVTYCIANGLCLSDLVGLLVWTSCRSSTCCRPEHLIVGTRAQHAAWRRRHGLTAQTPQAIASMTNSVRARPTTKLSMERARDMRALYADGKSLKEIGAAHGVSGDMARKVVRNRNWREATRGASVFNL